MQKTIIIDGKEVPMKASAATPVLYRNLYGKDLIMDMNKLVNAFEKGKKEKKSLDVASLECFEKIAYVMARSGAPKDEPFPETSLEWLDQFEMMSIYEVLPQIIELWKINQKQLNVSKKK